MESNITEQYSDGLQLSQPHFEAEATLLSARPVVPLHEIEAAERSNKRLTFGLALVAALVVGIFGATMIYRHRGQTPAAATIEMALPDANEAPEVPTVASAGGGKSEAPAPAFSTSATVNNLPARNLSKSAATRSPKPASSSVAPGTVTAKSTETTADEINNAGETRAERRAQRRETRRLKLAAQSDAGGEVRSRRVQRSDDLLRIREIFEGPPRPRRAQRWQ